MSDWNETKEDRFRFHRDEVGEGETQFILKV